MQAVAKHIVMRVVERLVRGQRIHRPISDAQIAQITASIADFGLNSPILADTKDGIIAGHGRVLAERKVARVSGWSASNWLPIPSADPLVQDTNRAHAGPLFVPA